MRCLLLVILVLMATAALAGPAGDTNWPRVTILAPAKAPVVDGVIAPGEWDQTVVLTGFTRLRQTDLIAHQPIVHLAWTPEALLVAAQIPSPPGQRARAHATDFDGTVWEDDSLEVHVDRGHQHKQNYQFVVNALGTKFDSLAGDKSFNAQWTAAARNNPGQWTAELSIPWAALGSAPKAGDVDGFNLIVNSSYLGGTLTLAPLRGSAHDAPSYAHLVYGQGAALSVAGLDAADLRHLTVRGLGQADIALEYKLTLAGKDLDTQSLKLAPNSSATIPVKIPIVQGLPQPGAYGVSLRATGAGAQLLVRQADFTVQDALRLTCSANETTGHLTVRLRTEPATFPAADAEYALTITGPAGVIKRVEHQRLPSPADTPVAILTRAEVPPGKLTLQVTATNLKTQQQYSVERTLDSPLQPEWLGTKEGLTDKVPAPWTPLSVVRTSVKCWGRLYDFARGPLPSKIITREAAVLASPITLTGRAEGQPLSWTSAAPKPTESKPNRVTLAGSAACGALKLTGTSLVEYDGMIRCDLTLTPSAGKATIQELTLEVPLKPEHARYLYHFPGRWGSVFNSGYLPKEGWQSPFKPFVWLGDEDRGFSWFCESDRNWFPLGSKTALTIERTAQATILKCHLIAQETVIEKPLTYTFGFQATPVKQPEKTVWDYHLTHHGSYSLEKQRAVTGGRISYPALGHIRKEEGTFECWYRTAVDSENTIPFADRLYPGNRDLFSVMWSPGMNGSNAGLYWNGTTQGLVGWSRTDGVVTDNPHTSQVWKAGQWRHIAMTWDKQKLRLYLDGKLISETPNNNFLGPALDQATIGIGGDGALATIDEVRILSVARPPTVPDKPFEPDAQTLLLDHFDNYAPAGGTPAPRGGQVGAADAWVKFGPGKFGVAPTWEPGQGKLRLDELAEQGVRTICFHEHWVPYQSYPHVAAADRPKLQALGAAMHERQLNLLLYMSRQFADNCPEWELHNEEFLLVPRGGAYTRMPAQRAYVGCWNSSFKDFALYYLGQTMDEFGHDGWYLDGPEWPQSCANREHGCGYQAPDGSWRPTWDLFATRDFMQRLYVLTRQRKPQGQLNIHNSTVMTIPTLGWGTSTWGGEQIDAIKGPVATLDAVPMDAFRTEFMGRQWGVPAEFLVYDGQPYYAKDVLAYTLLHGVLIRPGSPDSMERISALWKVHDEFPFSHGEMHGHWDNGGYVKIAGSPSGALTPELGQPAVYASLWTLPKQGALIVVSNLTDADAQARLSVGLAKLGLPPTARIWDALSGETLRHQQGALTLPVATWRYRVLRVK
jgi:hypothetical protein